MPLGPDASGLGFTERNAVGMTDMSSLSWRKIVRAYGTFQVGLALCTGINPGVTISTVPDGTLMGENESKTMHRNICNLNR